MVTEPLVPGHPVYYSDIGGGKDPEGLGSIPGVIKDHSSRNPDFANFLMDETDFKVTFKETLQFINQNLKEKE